MNLFRKIKLVKYSFVFEPRDIWIGVFWNDFDFGYGVIVYITIIPMLPFRMIFKYV